MSLQEFITCPAFDNIVGAVIILNATVIGFQTDYNATYVTNDVPIVYFIFEQFFAIWFTFELSLRVIVYKCKFFKPLADGWLWNYFDTFVVGAQLLEVFIGFVAASASIDVKNFRLLRVLRILRLVRILRVVRVLHLISELRAIVSSIVGSFRSLVWVVVLLLLMIYIVAVFFTQSIADHFVAMKEEALDEGRTWQSSEEENTLALFFSSIPRAILSLWQAMSGGLDWDTLAGPMFRILGFITGMAFAAFIAFALLALMNVVTGVFVQTALLSARDEEDSFMTSQIIKLFARADKDGSSTISMDEITTSLEEPACAKEWKAIGVQAEDARYLFKILDLEGKGEVPFEEFMGGCLRLSGQAKSIDVLTVMQEARKGEEKLNQKFKDLSAVILDIQEACEKQHTDAASVSNAVSFLIAQVSENREDIRSMMHAIGKAFEGVYGRLEALSLLEDLMTGSTTSMPGTAVV
jgi:hypothetical protein